MTTRNPYRYPFTGLISDGGGFPPLLPLFAIIPLDTYDTLVKIISSAIEGAETIYPDEYNNVIVPLLEYQFMDCNSIADCLLNNPIFRDSLAGIVNAIIENNDISSRGSGDYDANEGLKATATGLDEAYGGAKEVCEYWLDILKTVAFFIDGIGNFLDLGEQVYNRIGRRRYGNTGYIEGGVQKQLESGIDAIELSGNRIKEIPQIILQLAGAVSQQTFVGVLGDVGQLGASLVLADINDERLEALSCILFDEITCQNGQRTVAPYVFNTAKMQNCFTRFLSDENGGIAGFALGVLGNITTLGGIVSLFPIDETMREFGVGARNPSSEWALICANCDDTPPSGWIFTFNFLIQPYLDYWSRQTVGGQIQNPLVDWTVRGWGNGIEFDGARSREVARIEGVLSELSAPINITEMTTEYELVTGVSGSYFANAITIDKRVGTTWSRIYTQSSSGTQAGIYTITQTYGANQLAGLRVLVQGYQRVGNNNPQGATYIRKITLKGTGVNPFI